MRYLAITWLLINNLSEDPEVKDALGFPSVRVIPTEKPSSLLYIGS